MVNYHIIADRLTAGETVTFRPRGNSMTPRIMDGQQVTVRPFGDGEHPRVDDVVLAKVHGRFVLHLVLAVVEKENRFCIGNAHGHVNGCAVREKIYGIVVLAGDCGQVVKASVL